MKCRIFSIIPWAILFLFPAAQAPGGEAPVRKPAELRIERSSARREIDELRSYAMQTEYLRTLGVIGGLEITVRYGTVRFQRDPLGWGLEFTTVLPNMVPGPGNRRGIDIY
jgi:hypothetical protein